MSATTAYQVAVSLDGFIADPNGGIRRISWIVDRLRRALQAVDTLVMGRKT